MRLPEYHPVRPKIPQPGYTEADYTNAIDSGQFVYADCFTIVPLVGDPLYYTSAQEDVSVVPLDDVTRKTYRADQVLIAGLRMKNNLGVEVDEQNISLSYGEDLSYQAAITWPQALLQGRLDGSSIKRDRFIALAFGNGLAGETLWIGGSPMFRGLVSTLDTVGQQTATINVKSDIVLLNRQAPAWLFNPNCKNAWADPACGVDRNLWAEAATAGMGSTRSTLQWTPPSSGFDRGTVYMENGDGVTRVRTIARVSGSDILLAYPLDFDPLPGAAFVAYPNCRQLSDATTGCPKFHLTTWQEKFKGFPFTPVAETGF